MDSGNRRVDSRLRRLSTAAADNNNNNNLIIDQIMLRFRPIAPRPVAAERSGQLLPENVMRKRVKRKYVRVKKTKKMQMKMMITDKDRFDLDQVVVTDPLQKVTNWISFDTTTTTTNNTTKGAINNNNLFIYKPPRYSSDLHGADLTAAVVKQKVVESWITVETVTGTCEDRKLLGYTDEEIMKNLKADTCPGFISNGFGYDEVQWVNPAYRSMVNVNPNAGEVAVWLLVKVDKLTVEKYMPAFSCRVRIEYRSSEKKTPLTVPCDVCKMHSGEFAWRLDVKFALSLGPLN